MEKVMDYIYDFIGIFIPGFSFWLLLWLTTVLFLPIEAIHFLSTLFPTKMLLSDTSHPFVQAIASREGLVLVLVFIVCYISGVVFSEKHRFDSKSDHEKNTKAMVKGLDLNSTDAVSSDHYNDLELNDVYMENKALTALIDKELHSQMKVNWDAVNYNNKWIVYYRWANILSPNSSDRLNLQLMLAKIILHRSFTGVFKLLSWYVCILIFLGVLTDVFQLSVTFAKCAYYLICGVSVFVFYKYFLSRFFLRTSEKQRKLLQNESIIILSKYYLDKRD
ncbi:hypothetical protein [Paenibacillus sp. GCM10028914]|uniref:hypothetical protein n=1 Tax=Paenibacillus sp. GCM10028914 TaxID=3273416 RepID=UPI0036238DAF